MSPSCMVAAFAVARSCAFVFAFKAQPFALTA